MPSGQCAAPGLFLFAVSMLLVSHGSGHQQEAECLPALPMRSVSVDHQVLASLGVMVPHATRVHPSLVQPHWEPMLRLVRRAAVDVCFVHENSGLRSEFGYYTVSANGTASELHPLFPSVALENRPRFGCLHMGDCVTIGPLDAGTTLGFYVAPDMRRHPSRGKVFVSSDHDNPDGFRHFVLAKEQSSGALLLTYEESRLSEQEAGDFADGQFFLTVTPMDSQSPQAPALDERHLLHVMGGRLPAALQRCPTTALLPANRVAMHGRTYALLDGALPTDGQLGCQVGAARLPSGFVVAPPSPATFAALVQLPWAAECVALSDGRAFRPHSGGECRASEPFLLQEEEPEGAGGAAATQCFRVHGCARVLIVSERTAGEAAEGSAALGEQDLRARAEDSHTAWRSYGDGFSLVESPAAPCSPSDQGGSAGSASSASSASNKAAQPSAAVRLAVGDDLDRGAGLWRQVSSEALLSDGLVVSALSRSQGVSAVPWAPEVEYAVYIDVEYADGTYDYGVKVQFTQGSHDWEYRETTFVPRPGRRPRRANVYLLLRGVTGTAWFSCVRIRRGTGNVLRSPSFAYSAPGPDGRQEMPPWLHMHRHRATFTHVDASSPLDPFGRGSITCSGVPHARRGELCGAQQVVQYSPAEQRAQQWDALLLSGCATAVNVRDVGEEQWRQGAGAEGGQHGLDAEEQFFTSSADFALYADIWYADGSTDYGRVLPFPSGSFGWRCYAAVIPLRGPVARFVVAALIRRRWADSVAFDSVALVPLQGRGSRVAAAFGDPHIYTLGHEMYDSQAAGEFTLLDDGALQVQARFSPSGRLASAVRAVALRFRTSVLFVQCPPWGQEGEPVLRFNGGEVAATEEASVPLPGHRSAGGALRVSGEMGSFRDPFTVHVAYPSGQMAEVRVYRTRRGESYLNVQVSLPASNAERAWGMLARVHTLKPLLGPRQARPRSGRERALRAAEHASAAATVPAATIDDEWDYDALRVTDDTTFMYYEEGQGPHTFEDRDYGGGSLAHEYAADHRAAAQAACEATVTSRAMQQACVVDVLSMEDEAVVAALQDVEVGLGLYARAVLAASNSAARAAAAAAAAMATSACVYICSLLNRIV